MTGSTLGRSLGRARKRLLEDARGRNGRLLAVGTALALLAPLALTAYALDIVMQLFVAILVVGSWIFVAGYFGMFTFAHAALYGVGAYAAVLLVAEAGVNPIASILLGGVVAGLFSLPIAYPVLRLSGAYVGMVTLAYAEIIYRATILLREITGGPTGYTGFPHLFDGDSVAMYYFVLFVVAALMLVMYVLLVNRFGLVARAIRESPDAARMLGNDVSRHKLIGFVVGSSIAGVAGALQAYSILIISPPMLEIERMIEFMAMGIIGGLRTLSGGVFGVVVVFGLNELLRDYGEMRLVVWGAMLVVVTLYFPDGIADSDFDVRERLAGGDVPVRERIREAIGR
ncbi:branched-chain amino acid ABC transporter permease [Halorarum salinum]|uniref:Branched-chain amino acid ABC transporter permease n=1 Tax=Halorarum salinum TaxID=2743089 RepID=A0A7D5QCY2_9EURY|nr:branched-chain amino acid ABC transporter permease [Halobaculum salinum]QLG63419.1 branched-chain amino acid ABC transporter permease [Halobaculum salinum]